MKPYYLLDDNILLNIVKKRFEKILECTLTQNELFKIINNSGVRVNKMPSVIDSSTVRALKSLYINRSPPKNSNANYNSDSLDHLWIAKSDLIQLEVKLGTSEKVLDKSQQSAEKSEPAVIKGNISSLDNWMKWRIIEENLSLDQLMPYGLQATIIKETKEKFEYKDNSAVRDSWRRLGIKSATR